MRSKSSFKILITSPKGGVGKSTVSANLAAYMQMQGQSVTLLDFDNHGSSSSWLRRAPNLGVVVQHHPLPLHQGANRSTLDARLHLRRAAVSSDVVISDLTWSNTIAGELMFEYDLVIVPTSVSEIELAATVGFLNHHYWVFDSAMHTSPLLLLSPTRVLPEQLNAQTFSKQRFPVKFILPPPILEAQSAKSMFERGYLMDMTDACGQSFVAFGQAVLEAQTLSKANQTIRQASKEGRIVRSRSVLDGASSFTNQSLLLGKHRVHKVKKYDDLFKSGISAEKTKSSREGILVGLLNRWSASSH
jgi:cellulose biosynthesis protein BcsQ